MNARHLFSIAKLFVAFSICSSSRILLVFPTPASSHFILGSSLARGLAKAGHDVTLIAAYEDEIAAKTGQFKQIVLQEIDEDMQNSTFWEYSNLSGSLPVEFVLVAPSIIPNPQADFLWPTFPKILKLPSLNKKFYANEQTPFPYKLVGILYSIERNVDMYNVESSTLKAFSTFAVTVDSILRHTLNSSEIKQLIKKGCTFDVVIIEEMVLDSLKVLPYLFKAPYIAFAPFGPDISANDLVSNPSPLSYVPQVRSGLPAKMTFLQRMTNLMTTLVIKLLGHMYLINHQKDILKEYYPDAPNINDLKYNVSLLLLNSHVSTFQAVPSVPSMISIGGYHVQPPKVLPKDLKDFLDNAKDGVVYFSMGSIVKSKNMPQQKLNVIVGAFKKLKQKVLWKWEAHDFPGKPHNVLTRKWLPQQDILAHQNVKLFITHGGLLSTTETIYHGKPVLVIPIFCDQPNNAQQMVSSGFALSQKFEDLTDSEVFLSKIKELLYNPKYLKNAQTRSKIMHDQPVKPMDLAVFWIEYIIRHKGAPHLRVAGADLTWYQYYLLDVFVFLFIVSLLIIAAVLGAMFFVIKKNILPPWNKKKHLKLKKI